MSESLMRNLLVTEGFDGVELGGFAGGVESEEDSDPLHLNAFGGRELTREHSEPIFTNVCDPSTDVESGVVAHHPHLPMADLQSIARGIFEKHGVVSRIFVKRSLHIPAADAHD